jgi:hypothetical protein
MRLTISRGLSHAFGLASNVVSYGGDSGPQSSL